MYSFEPTEEQQMLVEAMGKYAVNDLRAAAREAEEGGELPGKVGPGAGRLACCRHPFPNRMAALGSGAQ